MIPIRRTLFLLALALSTVAATALPAPAGAIVPERYIHHVFDDVDIVHDLAYGAAPDEHGQIQELNLDIYTPVGDTLAARPAIILAHGGSFVGGNKSSMAEEATAYAERGFVAMSIEYRMDEEGGGVSFPPGPGDIVRIINTKHDMQAAVRWARANAATFGIDPQRISVGGGSAGAVTAVLTATMADDPGASGNPGYSSKVCTAISIMGAGEPALIDPSDAGAIFFHGEEDTTVPYSAALDTQAAMDAAGLPTEMVSFPGAGHSIPDGALVEQRSSEWMVEHMVDRETGCAGPSVPANASFVRAAYEDLLGRAATDDEVVQEAGFLDTGGSKGTLLTRLTTSDEWLGSIVTGFYADTLGREPDTDGLEFWVGALRSGRFTVAQVAGSFYASAEYRQGRGEEWVLDLYDAILDRVPADGDLAYWVEQIDVNGPSWVAVNIYQSLESRQQRVAALYEHLLDRSPEPDGLAFWSARVRTAGDLSLARSLAASGEYAGLAVTRFP